MLACDDASAAHAHLSNLAGKRLRAFEHPLLAAVKKHVGVQVAVSGMEDIRHPQSVARAHFIDFGQRRAKLAARHHPILNNVSLTDAPQRGEGTFAPLPDQRPLGLVLRAAHAVGRRGADDLL